MAAYEETESGQCGPRFLGTVRGARLPFVAADNPHATELTVDTLAAVAADEIPRTAERARAALAVKKARGAVLGRRASFTAAGQSLGRARTLQQRHGRSLVWALAHGAAIRQLAASPCADAAPSLRELARAPEAV